MCTTVPPAKSIAPFLKIQPASALTSSSLACAAVLAARQPPRKRLGGASDRVRAGPVPDHVRDREVDQRHPERDEQRDRRELHAFGEGADDEGRRDRREGHLEADVDELRDVGADAEGRRLGVRGHAHQEGLREAADEVEPPVKARL
jgi:hypothetical protein